MEEETPFYMWAKQKSHLASSSANDCQLASAAARRSNLSSYDDSSWEEQAFAEDGIGCVWPPRSYSCSFCRREFRSAQALGGHMNVHRRDRARLKQSHHDHHQNSHNEIIDHNHNLTEKRHIIKETPPNPNSGFYEYPSEVCALIYNSPNPKTPPHDLCILSTTSSSSRVSAPPINKNQYCSTEHDLFPPYSSSSSYKSKDDQRNKNISRVVEDFSECKAKGNNNYVKADLSVSLSLVLRRAQSTIMSSEDKEDGSICRKRKRYDAEPDHGAMNELDLELRLGGLPS